MEFLISYGGTTNTNTLDLTVPFRNVSSCKVYRFTDTGAYQIIIMWLVGFEVKGGSYLGFDTKRVASGGFVT